MPPAKMSAPWEPPDTMGDEEQEAEPATSSQLLPLLFGGTPRKAQTLVGWVEARKAAERGKFQPWGEIIPRISAKEFATQRALALAYGKPSKWATTLKKVALQHGVFTGESWRACFIGVRGCGSQYDPSITSARGPGGGSPRVDAHTIRGGISSEARLSHVQLCGATHAAALLGQRGSVCKALQTTARLV